MQLLLQHATIAWKLGIRSHATRALLAVGLALLIISYLAGAFSLRQPLVVTLDFGISGIRILSALLTLFWIQEAFMRDIERKTLTLAFSLPGNRSTYVLGRFFGVMALVSLAILIWGLALAIADQYAEWGYLGSSRPVWNYTYAALLIGIILDAFVIGAFVLAITSVAQTTLLPFLVGAAFALAARSIGGILDYLAYSSQASPELKESFLQLLDYLRWIIPDLGLLDWRASILYDQSFPWAKATAGGAIALGYTTLFLLLAVLAYRKREIN